MRRLYALFVFLALICPLFAYADYCDELDPDKACYVNCSIEQETVTRGGFRSIRQGFRHRIVGELHNKSGCAFKRLTVEYSVYDGGGNLMDWGGVKIKKVEPYGKVEFDRILKHTFRHDKLDLDVKFEVKRGT